MAAHPLDQVLQQVYVTPAAGVLEVQIDIVPGALVAGAFARSVDTDGDRALSAGETAAHTETLRATSAVRVDGRAEPLTITSAAYPAYDLLAAGGGTISVRGTAPLPAASRQVTVRDGYRPGQPTSVQMSVTLARGAALAPSDIHHGESGRSITVDLAPPAVSTAVEAPAAPGLKDRAFAALRSPLASPWALLVLLAVCALLGAFHALTPGHGKAMLAAYLVGSKGTRRQALFLGLVITVTHTASVVVLGAAVLLAGRHVLPDVLVPSLELAAGLIVLILGLRVVRHRWSHRASRHADTHARAGAHGHIHEHAHTHEHGHPHGRGDDGHGAHGHPHGDGDHGHPHGDGDHGHQHGHHHGPLLGRRSGPGAGRGALAALGVSGGLLPCPEALGILILAAGLNRTALGLGMIAAFSAGLAAVLVALGLVLVSGARAIKKPGPASLAARLPLVSAAVVVVLGLVMTVSGAAHFAEAGALAAVIR
ncbi:hypothetical protein Ade02nite_32640 [Paractinoplanes deccanensis]|uniref:Nickel/cobalt efflux system n=1 Tax=Paractinoplanes deccanensis TaxID=113561 RepID=A0ABQ3Y3Q5_9ACTN|nr:hypothetical protein [Actinoplanes deccanensis]GID74623.1 hypothetical protein Ade02nite_32640 [Actinoplanes deccanensis]